MPWSSLSLEAPGALSNSSYKSSLALLILVAFLESLALLLHCVCAVEQSCV